MQIWKILAFLGAVLFLSDTIYAQQWTSDSHSEYKRDTLPFSQRFIHRLGVEGRAGYIFQTSPFLEYSNHQYKAMKNAYALAVSLAVGLSERIEGVGGTLHYNSQAALFAQSIREMRRLLKLIGGHEDNIVYGVGDLYVAIFGGRTRKIGTLLGRGVSFDDAMAQLSGITLESVVISTRTARAVRKLIERGLTTADDFPLLLHIDDIINHGAEVNIPWEKFEMETVL